MDPNLTLAHITHNTAVILLHQGIAYPPAHWQSCPIKLPSASSAETCLEAASEIATIGHQFLSFSPIFTNPQFSFCLFIAGRMLLAHARYNQVPIPPTLDTLIASLLEISQRWTGCSDTTYPGGDNLASSFAKRLIEAPSNLMAAPRPSLDIRQTAYSDESKDQPQQQLNTSTDSSVASLFLPKAANAISPSRNMSRRSMQELSDFDPFSLAFPPLPPAFQPDFIGLSRSDPLCIYAQATESQAPSSLGLQSLHNQQSTMWQGHTLYTDGIVSPQEDMSYVLSLGSSPGQRISRYGGPQIQDDRNLGTGRNNNAVGT